MAISSPPTAGRWRIFVTGPIYVIAIVIFALCVASLAKATGLFGTTTKEDLSHAVAVFGVGLAVICGLLWAADAAAIITLRKGLRTALWSTLIVSILAATVAVYKGYFSTPTAPPTRSRVDIDSLHLVKEDALSKESKIIELRSNQTYYGATAPIAFATCFSGLELDTMGKFDAELVIALVNEARGIAEYGVQPIRESPAKWKSRTTPPQSRQISELGCGGNIQFVALLSDRADIGTGPLKLRFTVIDRLTGFTDTKAASLVIKPTPERLTSHSTGRKPRKRGSAR